MVAHWEWFGYLQRQGTKGGQEQLMLFEALGRGGGCKRTIQPSAAPYGREGFYACQETSSYPKPITYVIHTSPTQSAPATPKPSIVTPTEGETYHYL